MYSESTPGGGVKPVAPPWLCSGGRSMNQCRSRGSTSNSCRRMPRAHSAAVCWYSGTPTRLPSRSAGGLDAGVLADQDAGVEELPGGKDREPDPGVDRRVSVRDQAARTSTSRRPRTPCKCSWRQKISEGWTFVTCRSIPSAFTRPAWIGAVRGLSESATPSSMLPISPSPFA